MMYIARDDELFIIGKTPDMYGWSIRHYLTSFPRRALSTQRGEAPPPSASATLLYRKLALPTNGQGDHGRQQAL